MKVKLLQAFAGADFTYSSGDVIEVSEASALRLFADNCAVPVMPENERAVTEAPEKAVVIQRRTPRGGPVSFAK